VGDAAWPPGMALHLRSPDYLLSLGPGASQTVHLQLNTLGVSPSAAFAALGKILGVWNDKGARVAGQLGPVLTDQRAQTQVFRLTWKPEASLAEGDYRVSVDPTKAQMKYYAVPREHHVFHVGALPRVRRVDIEEKGQSTTIIVLFSEPVRLGAIVGGLSVYDAKAPSSKLSAALDPGSPSHETPVTVAIFTAPTKKSYRLELGKDVGAASGLELDGLYSGKAGSGDFSAEIEVSSLESVPGSNTRRWYPSIVMPGM
jgi:hypothetical protein